LFAKIYNDIRNSKVYNVDRTRVPTTVAIEFAESWNPFTKSKKSAVVTIP
jgi:hypothetical protein